MYHRVAIDATGLPGELWFRTEARFGALLSDRVDAALVALVYPAMERGENIILARPVTDELLFNMDRVQALLRSHRPSLQLVSIEVSETVPPNDQASGVATGFSAGIDSFAALMDYHYGNPPRHLQLTHLLFNNVGSHDRGGERLFAQRYQRAARLVKKLGLPFVAVDSNLDDFYTSSGYHRSHTLRNVAAALALQSGLGRFLYASGYSYRGALKEASDDIARIDAMLLPLLSAESFKADAIGGQYTRVEKTMRVAGNPDSFDHLDVCVNIDADGNCSRCFKCLRTLATLDIGGQLGLYQGVFDLQVYRRHRTWHFAKILGGRDTLNEELQQFIIEREFGLPPVARLLAPLAHPAARARVAAGAAKARWLS
jgi:hypothetical protein